MKQIIFFRNNMDEWQKNGLADCLFVVLHQTWPPFFGSLN